MKLYGGRYRSRKNMKRALGMSGDKAGLSARYFLNPVTTDNLGNRFVKMAGKAGRAINHKLSSGRGR